MKKRSNFFRLGRRSFLKMLVSIGSGTLLQLARRRPAIVATDGGAHNVRAADLVVRGIDFFEGEQEGTAAGANGLWLPNGGSGNYLSPVIEAPIPFNAIVPQWLAEVPEGGSIVLHLRTGDDEGQWSDWFYLPPSDDWTRPEDVDVVGTMLAVPESDGTHTRFQYAVQMTGALTGQPNLQEIRFTCLDTTQGPTAAELMAMQSAMRFGRSRAESGIPKPQVVSRALWCTDAACYYSAGLDYEPVTHLVVHHTVTSNGSSNWAAIVRAIWYFHTFTRGWGDIGYNYLVDMNGVLYEGHLGGDDVVGTHAAGANEGSMALAFIGTFTESNASPPGISPPPAMLDAATELLAWKALQKGINVYDASRLRNVSWGLPHLMGHRDVYGTTSCPGQQAFDLLPWLRDEVARRMGFHSDYIYVDELSGAFTKSNANWYDGPYGCGFGGHAYYTWSTTDATLSANWGEWALPIPQDGWYEVAVYAPYGNTGRGDTHGARYELTHANGVDTIVVDQGANLGVWVTLGDFYFLQGQASKLFLSDLTTTDNNLGLWFDAIRLLPRSALPAVSIFGQEPLADTWSVGTTVDFSWILNNPAVVAELRLEVAVDADFATLVLSQVLAPTATAHSHDFGQDYTALYWRLVVKTLQNSFIESEPVRFGIDTTPPSSSASQVLFDPRENRFAVLLSGNDASSGIATYDVDVQAEGDTNWMSVASGLSQPTAFFTPPDASRVYWFRSRATDVAGNVEAQHATGDVSTAGAALLDEHVMLPIIADGDSG